MWDEREKRCIGREERECEDGSGNVWDERERRCRYIDTPSPPRGPNLCTCNNGIPVTGRECTTSGANICQNCVDGYTLNGNNCVQNPVDKKKKNSGGFAPINQGAVDALKNRKSRFAKNPVTEEDSGVFAPINQGAVDALKNRKSRFSS